MSLVASTLGVGRSTVYDRLAGSTKARGPYAKADDADLLPRIRQIAAQRQRSGGGLVDRALQSDDTFGEGVTGRGSHAVCKIRL